MARITSGVNTGIGFLISRQRTALRLVVSRIVRRFNVISFISRFESRRPPIYETQELNGVNSMAYPYDVTAFGLQMSKCYKFIS